MMMGQWCSVPVARPHKVKLLIVGLDGAGKTSILYRLKLNEARDTTPTVAPNFEKLYHNNTEIEGIFHPAWP